MNVITQLLADREILVADGSWGTQLAARGLLAGQAPEQWNLDNPDAVRGLGADYVAAGADMILTNTFGGNPLKLDKVGLGGRAIEINRIGAALSREAAGNDALVIGSIGPTGEFIQPLGLISEDEMVAVFAEQVRGLADGAVDAILVETQTDLDEARAAIRATRDNFDGPVICSMTFDKGPAGYATMMGVKPEQAAQDLEAAGADVVGANCGAGADLVVGVIALMRPVTDLPLWAKPNAGLPELVQGETVFRETPEQMAARFPDLVEAGASIIGGCCGTTPDHIRALVAARDAVVG